MLLIKKTMSKKNSLKEENLGNNYKKKISKAKILVLYSLQ